jgi:hypothetical protein
MLAAQSLEQTQGLLELALLDQLIGLLLQLRLALALRLSIRNSLRKRSNTRGLLGCDNENG